MNPYINSMERLSVHLADWEPHDPSPSGKCQWRCKRCGRITQGAEKECLTPETMTEAETDEWAARIFNP
jgi:hypothetical protein